MPYCVINLSTPAERFALHQAKLRQSRRTLLATIREVNNSSVHPLNHNYLTAESPDGKVYLWALVNDLLTPTERHLLAFS